MGKAAAHVLEEVCKRIGYCDRDAERWNYVTVLYKAVKTYVRRLCNAYKNSMKILTAQKLKVPQEKKMFVGLHIFAKCGMNPFDLEKPAYAAHLETSQDSIYNSLI